MSEDMNVKNEKMVIDKWFLKLPAVILLSILTAGIAGIPLAIIRRKKYPHTDKNTVWVIGFGSVALFLLIFFPQAYTGNDPENSSAYYQEDTGSSEMTEAEAMEYLQAEADKINAEEPGIVEETITEEVTPVEEADGGYMSDEEIDTMMEETDLPNINDYNYTITEDGYYQLEDGTLVDPECINEYGFIIADEPEEIQYIWMEGDDAKTMMVDQNNLYMDIAVPITAVNAVDNINNYLVCISSDGTYWRVFDYTNSGQSFMVNGPSFIGYGIFTGIDEEGWATMSLTEVEYQ